MAKNTGPKSQQDSERFAQRAAKIERILTKASATAKTLIREKNSYFQEVMALVAEAQRAGWRVELTQESGGKVISSVDLRDNPAGFLSLQTLTEDSQQSPSVVFTPDPIFCWAVGCPPISTAPGKICFNIGCYIGYGTLRCVRVCVTEIPM